MLILPENVKFVERLLAALKLKNFNKFSFDDSKFNNAIQNMLNELSKIYDFEYDSLELSYLLWHDVISGRYEILINIINYFNGTRIKFDNDIIIISMTNRTAKNILKNVKNDFYEFCAEKFIQRYSLKN